MVTRNEGKDKVTFVQACLDVHLGEVARRLAANRSEEQVAPIGGKFRIAAGDVLSIRSEEDFRLPADVQGQVSPKAKLTTLGLFFPTTHVDPGFTGPLFLPIINAGPRAVLLPVGEAVGKVELQRLASAVHDPWKGTSGFGNFRDDWVVEGPTVADDREAVRTKIRLLQAWCIALTMAVLTLMVAPQLRSIGIHLNALEEDVVAPVVVLAVAGASKVVATRVRMSIKRLWDHFWLK
jgi:deoxycytidine triphosphate deaminase